MDGMVNSLLLDGPDVYVLEVVMMLVPLRRRVLREVGGGSTFSLSVAISSRVGSGAA